MNGCGLRYQLVLRVLSFFHLGLVVTNFFVIDPDVFDPLYVIYTIGTICFFTLIIYTFITYRAWFFVLTLAFQGLYILSAGYLASLALMGYFTIKMALLRLIFCTNTLVIIIDVISIITVISIRSEFLRQKVKKSRNLENLEKY